MYNFTITRNGPSGMVRFGVSKTVGGFSYIVEYYNHPTPRMQNLKYEARFKEYEKAIEFFENVDLEDENVNS